jgi:hypothetical protein
MDDILTSIADGAATGETAELVLRLPGEELELLIHAIGSLKSEHAGRFLSLLYPSLADKTLQKLVKKELFRLKTQGIPVEDPRTPGESVLKKVETGREARAFLSNYDAEMTRVVLVAFEMKKNQFLLSQAVLHFSDGLVELKSFPMARDELEDFLKDYALRMPPSTVLPSISAAYAGYLIEEASGLSGKEAEEAASLHRMLLATKGDVGRPSDIYLLEGEDTVSEASAEAVFADEIFEPFSLRWPGMEEDRKKLNDMVNPTIVLPSYMIEEKRQAFLNELVDKETLAARLPQFRRMLEDYAYLFYCLGNVDYYKGLLVQLAEAAAVKRAFLRFVQKAFGKPEEADRRQEGVIIDPHSLMKRRSP